MGVLHEDPSFPHSNTSVFHFSRQLETIFRPWARCARSDAIDNCPASLAAISRNLLLTIEFGSWMRIGTPLSPPSRNAGVIGISPRYGILNRSAARSAPPREKISCCLPQPSQIEVAHILTMRRWEY